MAANDAPGFELRPANDLQGFEDFYDDHDPQLQEELLKLLEGRPGSTAISRDENGTRKVTAIARLSALDLAVDGLTFRQPPSDEEARDPYGPGYVVPAEVDLKKLTSVLGHENVLSLKAADDVHLHLYNSVPASQCDRTALDNAAHDNGNRFPGLDGSDVVIGIVDFGCDFRHRNFRYPSGATRIRYFWDQTEPHGGSSLAGDVRPPQDYGYGREFTAEMIDKALESGDAGAYDTLGYTPPIAAHGTHVMDIAAGNGYEPALFNGKPGNTPAEPSTPGVAPGAQLIFVQLQIYERGGGLANSCHLLEGVEYIFRKADELGLPAVINLSLSSTGGPHDGTTLIERRFEAMVKARRGRAIVISAGNSYELRSHLSGEVGEETTIEWNTDPRNLDPDRVKNAMEIWYPGNAQLQVTLYAPDTENMEAVIGSIDPGQTMGLFADGKRVGRISHRKMDRNNGDNQVDIRLPHPENNAPWRIKIANLGQQLPVPFDAWIEQSERGLAYFSGDADPRSTLGSISCGNGTLTVGAFDTFEMASLSPPYEATSSGPIRKSTRIDLKMKPANPQETPAAASTVQEPPRKSKPELSAPGVNIVAARSQGGVTAFSGTSMAAPHVTGVIALLFQLAQISGRGLLSFADTRQILTYGLKPLTRIDSPNPEEALTHDLRLGYGRINGSLAVAALFRKIAKAISIEFNLDL